MGMAINNINEFINYLESTFYNPIELKYVNKLSKLEYKPSKTFLNHLKDEFKQIKLLGSQRISYKKIIRAIESNVLHDRKTFINISGTAGSGKTIVAFKVLNYLAMNGNHTRLILPGPEFRDSILKSNNFTTKEFIGGAYAKGQHDYTIVDEAHKARGNGYASAFYNSLFKHSNFVITLLDDMQVINKKGITKSQVETIAFNNGYVVQEMNLTEQFRNASDATYTDWLHN
jgi:type I site-specific restriction endonuclease